MNSLEWIDAEITKWQEILESFKEQLIQVKGTRNEQSTLNHIEFYELRLKYLHQIKSELEIMELIKNGWSSMEQTLSGEKIIKFGKLNLDDWLKVWKTLEEIGLQKALEVENNYEEKNK